MADVAYDVLRHGNATHALQRAVHYGWEVRKALNGVAGAVSLASLSQPGSYLAVGVITGQALSLQPTAQAKGP